MVIFKMEVSMLTETADSTFSVRRAKVRWGDGDWNTLHTRLQELVVGVEKQIGLKSVSPVWRNFRLHWDVRETVLHDEDAECVPDDYPVLIVEVRMESRDKLWVETRYPFEIVIELYSIRFRRTNSRYKCDEVGDPITLIADGVRP
jgi:hypothetical protein